MYSKLAIAWLVLVLGVSSLRADDADPAKLEAQMEKLLAAYNKDDVRAFFRDWASSVKAITTEATYDALFKNGAKKTVGDYKAKTVKFRKDGSVLSGDFLVVYFTAQFDKERAGLITANFAREDGTYRFMQVRMEKQP